MNYHTNRYLWTMGIDIVRPLSQKENRYRYIVIAIDYFFKWPEVWSFIHANAQQVAKFIYEKIICKFSISKVLQSDREIHFVNKVKMGS